jgi:hypothetical protein
VSGTNRAPSNTLNAELVNGRMTVNIAIGGKNIRHSGLKILGKNLPITFRLLNVLLSCGLVLTTSRNSDQ